MTSSVEERLYENSELVENALYGYLSNDDEDLKELFDSQKYSLFAGGKRIRPTLTLEFCRMFGGEDKCAIPFACAVEMVHTYSLIHDDLPCMDNDDMRRGKPTNHKVFGEAVALLAGDALLTGAFEVISSNPYCSPEVNCAAVNALASAAGGGGMIGGQIMDIHADNNPISFEELYKLQYLKTGSLIKVSAILGCLAAGIQITDERLGKVIKYANSIGFAFQITDDILDACGDENVIGKTVKTDSKHNKTTFLSFYSVKEAREYVKKLTDDAVSAISSIPLNDFPSDLAYYLCDREK